MTGGEMADQHSNSGEGHYFPAVLTGIWGKSGLEYRVFSKGYFDYVKILSVGVG